jgi:hypothetical protein
MFMSTIHEHIHFTIGVIKCILYGKRTEYTFAPPAKVKAYRKRTLYLCAPDNAKASVNVRATFASADVKTSVYRQNDIISFPFGVRMILGADVPAEAGI